MFTISRGGILSRRADSKPRSTSKSRRRFVMRIATPFCGLIFLVNGRAIGEDREFPVSEQAAQQVLEQYVAKADDNFGWKVRRNGMIGATAYSELILTSQRWRGIEWKHQLFILRPSKTSPDNKQALLLIAGSSWKDELELPPDADASLPGEAKQMALLAEVMQTPVAILLQVPKQPMFDGKHEDALISYTFEEFVKTADTQWPLLLPMTKSAVRAMDAVQAHCRDQWKVPVETFTVTGASKRGWTTWLTGAVDKRVTAMAPMVIDVLKMQAHLELQKKSWGTYSEQIADYTEKGLHDLMATPAGKILRTIVDPYSYRQKCRQPKLLLIGTNDRYWPLDALNLYWQDLVGPKYVLYVPNVGHGLEDMTRVTGSINALHQHAARGFQLPQLKWSFTRDDQKLTLRLKSDKPPRRVNAWTATSKNRDFRNSKFKSYSMKQVGKSYEYEITVPESGHAVLFGEAVYGDLTLPYYFSTNLQIVSRRSASVTLTPSDSD